MSDSPTGRTRGLALLLVAFVAGGLAGGAADRAYITRADAQRTAQEDSVRTARAGWRREGGRVEEDYIPDPLRALELTPDQETRLRAIAHRWRPQAGSMMEEVRSRVSNLENDMFAEMLCIVTPSQRDKYLKALHDNRMDEAVIAKRFELVRTNGCAKVTAATP